MAKELATTEKKPKSLEDMLNLQLPAIRKALPRTGALDPQRFVRIALTTVRKNPKLLQCAIPSILASVQEAAQLGLVIDGMTGEAYLVPFKGHAVLIPGYRGLMKLARRSDRVATIESRLVYRGEEFRQTWGSERSLVHIPSPWGSHEKQDVLGAYALATVRLGDKEYVQWETMSADDIEKIRQRSPGKDGDAWSIHWLEMARKTVVRRLCKYLPMDTDDMRLVNRDEALETDTYDPVDDAVLVQAEEEAQATIDAADHEPAKGPTRVQAPSQDPEPTSLGATTSVRENAEEPSSEDRVKEDWLAVCAELAIQRGATFDEKKARKMDLAGLKQFAKTLGYKED